MKLKDFLEMLESENPDLDVLFDVKDVESFLDFAQDLWGKLQELDKQPHHLS